MIMATENYETSSKTYSNTSYDLLRIDARRRNAKYLLLRANEGKTVKSNTTLPRDGYFFKSHSVTNFEDKHRLIFRDGSFRSLKPHTSTYIRALHPIVTLVKLSSMLREFGEQVDVESMTKELLRDAFTCHADIGLLHSIQCCGNDSLSLAPFILHSDNYFVSDTNRSNSSRKPVSSYQNFSFCAIQYLDNVVVVCRIMSIIALTRPISTTMKEERFLLLILRLHTQKPTNTVQVFPFTSLKYNYNRDHGYELDVVELSSFHTPVCVFESPTHSFETIASISTDTIFYQIPTSRLLNTEPVLSYAQFQKMREEATTNQRKSTGVYLTEDELNEILECYQGDKAISRTSVGDYEGSDSDCSASLF